MADISVEFQKTQLQLFVWRRWVSTERREAWWWQYFQRIW
jgi:hypothetical protein